ncbi:Protein of unknown function DUF2993 [Actinobacteria bacterium OV450]|nr:Protein of unknown function DUF2993 [Actinobacteria bacterium OV450]
MNHTAPSEAPARAVGHGTGARRPRRTRRLVLAGACALIAGLVLTDRVAAGVTEGRMADRMAARQSALVAAPDVSIDGFPFLWHAAAGSYPQVEVEGRAETQDGLPVTAAFDLHDVSRRRGGYSASAARAAFSVPLDALAAKRGSDVRLTGRDGKLQITRTIMGMPLVVTAALKLTGDTVTLEPTAASLAGRALDPANPRIVAALNAVERKIPELPLGLAPSSVSVDDGAVTVHSEAKDLALPART